MREEKISEMKQGGGGWEMKSQVSQKWKEIKLNEEKEDKDRWKI